MQVREEHIAAMQTWLQQRTSEVLATVPAELRATLAENIHQAVLQKEYYAYLEKVIENKNQASPRRSFTGANTTVGENIQQIPQSASCESNQALAVGMFPVSYTHLTLPTN